MEMSLLTPENRIDCFIFGSDDNSDDNDNGDIGDGFLY